MEKLRTFAEAAYPDEMDSARPDWTWAGENDALHRASEALEYLQEFLEDDIRAKVYQDVESGLQEPLQDLRQLAEDEAADVETLRDVIRSLDTLHERVLDY